MMQETHRPHCYGLWIFLALVVMLTVPHPAHAQISGCILENDRFCCTGAPSTLPPEIDGIPVGQCNGNDFDIGTREIDENSFNPPTASTAGGNASTASNFNQSTAQTVGVAAGPTSCKGGTQRGCYPGIRGETCVYFPCGEDRQVIICDSRGCDGVGAEPLIPEETDDCVGCDIQECNDAARILLANHEQYERAVMVVVSEEMRKHRLWLREVFFKDQILPALMKFTEQMSAVSMHQTAIIGQFIDAKAQLETQRTFEELKIQAHSDYRPSEHLCRFGTSVRSLAESDVRTENISLSLSAMQRARALRTKNTTGSLSVDSDKYSRWKKFKEHYCDPKDNNWTRPIGTLESGKETGSGLALACGLDEAPQPQRANIDIDYTRLVDEPRTLDVDLLSSDQTNTEEDVLALSQNLYGHDVLSENLPASVLSAPKSQESYFDLRSVVAKRSVAEHSFNSIVALKSPGSPDMANENGANTTEYLNIILEELGLGAPDEGGATSPALPNAARRVTGIVDQAGASDATSAAAEAWIGKTPSYYAQLEILSKRIYQNPNFFVNLYDTPVNVKRKYVAMLAIERMLDHALLESQQRQEMLVSVMLSSKLRKNYRNVERKITAQ